jgi:glycosyltransferase involved in cell wall biosynthesis
MSRNSVLMIVENYFPYDIRVRKEAYTLSDYYKLSVIALKRKEEKYCEKIDGIEIFRIPEIYLNNKAFHKIGYVLQYIWFSLMSLFIFMATLIKNRYRVIHTHNPPDTLFVIAIIGKLFSIKYIYDHHDLCPELYLSRFSGEKDLFYKMLLIAEKYSCKMADKIITTNTAYKQITVERHSVLPEKIAIVRNNPSLEEFEEIRSFKEPEKTKKVLLYVGSINPQDGIEILLQALHFLVYNLNEKDFICYIVGEGDSLSAAVKTAKQLNMLEYVYFKGLISDRKKIMHFYHLADICLEPAPDNELNRHSTFIKVMEYMAAGKPVIAFDLPESRRSADGAALFVPPGDIEGFSFAIMRLLRDAELRTELGTLGKSKVNEDLNWDHAACTLLEVYSSLLN